MKPLPNVEARATQPLEFCSLCGLDLGKHPVREDAHAFCCPGCHAVYRILETKGQLEDFSQHPLFLQAVQAGLISNPALLAQVSKSKEAAPEEEWQKLHLEVGELWCPSCAELIRLVLLQEPGVRACVVDYSTDLASVEYWPRKISQEEVIEKIRSLGYPADRLEEGGRKAISRLLLLRFGVAVFCALNIMMFSLPHYLGLFSSIDEGYPLLFSQLSAVFAVPILGFSALPIFRRFGHSLRMGLFGMETLVVIGVSTAASLSAHRIWHGDPNVYFDSMGMVIVFVLLGKMIEARAKFSARTSLLRLSRALPRRGKKRFPDGTERYVTVKELQVGDTLILHAGEKAVLDGVVVEGEGVCDEAIITGEARPVQKSEGDTVIGGSVLQQGWLAYRVTVEPEQSTLSKIIGMVEVGLDHKTVYERAADRVVRWFVPVILLTAFFTGLGVFWLGGTAEQALIRVISVLLISCPCAIGIAAPLAESLLMQGLAKMGAIVRNRGILPVLGTETTWVFDKTGTLTYGTYTVLHGLERVTKQERSVLKGLASRSQHPVSVAIAAAIDCDAAEVSGFCETAGQGVAAEWNGQRVLLGTASFLERAGVDVPTCNSENSLVYFSIGPSVVTYCELGDEVRPQAKEAIAGLSELNTVVLSGDSVRAVAKLARMVGVKRFHGRCTPLEKREYIDRLREEGACVAMVGDGINDAPALAGAQIGFSVVSATDISIQVSDVLLTTDNLTVLPKLRKLAMKGRRIVQQNMFWAFAYNGVGIALAIAGVLTPLFAAFAMVASSLAVVFNALRLRK